MKEQIIKIKPYLLKIFVAIAIFSLYSFLFNDFFNVGDASMWYVICATFLTIYLYEK